MDKLTPGLRADIEQQAIAFDIVAVGSKDAKALLKMAEYGLRFVALRDLFLQRRDDMQSLDACSKCFLFDNGCNTDDQICCEDFLMILEKAGLWPMEGEQRW
jgi:hypothetical protein